ncbi:MAG: hypothetical protein ACI9DC_001853 [Gammaproteobacteria bacterium]|jgi:hypothetical protein
MSPATSPLRLKGTRLVRFLADLAVSDVALSHENFTDRLGRVINIKESLRLLAFHDQLSMTPYEPSSSSCEGLSQEVLRARRTMVQTVVTSFASEVGPARLQLPTLKADTALDELAKFQPYHRFYIAHQREFESKIHSLQRRVRVLVSGLSRELAQLAALDAAVWDILSMHTHNQLAVIPQLLGKRFDFLQQDHRSPQTESGTQMGNVRPQAALLEIRVRPEAWQARFLTEIQGLLLAELELRLLPVLGLVEAVNEEVARR